MAIDGYALCPGGTGKKIKFCCPDALPDLEKIAKMIEGEQLLACRQFLDRLMEQPAHRDRACLLAFRTSVLSETGEAEAALAESERFVEKHPDNPLARALHARLLLAKPDGRAREALLELFRGLSLGKGEPLPAELFDMLGPTATHLMDEGYCVAAAAVARLHVMALRDGEGASLLRSIMRHDDFPPLLKDLLQIAPAADDSPAAAALEEVVDQMHGGRWLEAEARLAELSEQYPAEPMAWKNLAAVRAWLTDHEGSAAAMKELAKLNLPAEEAAETAARAALLSEDPLGDNADELVVRWTVRDFDRLYTALLSDPRVIPEKREYSAGFDRPPRGVFAILDRPMPEGKEKLGLGDLPRMLGVVALFGKQTDRDAELTTAMLDAAEVAVLQASLEQLAPGALDPEAKTTVLRSPSASYRLVSQLPVHIPSDCPPDRVRSLVLEWLLDRLLTQWSQKPLGILGGRTPAEAARQPELRVPLQAAILVLESWIGESQLPIDLTPLRIRLGLPLPGPIDLAAGQIRALPLIRLARVIVEKLGDEDLVFGFDRAVMYRALNAIPIFAKVIVTRPSLATNDVRVRAYYELAQLSEDHTATRHWIEEGRKHSEAAGGSSAQWDLLELSLCFRGNEPDRAVELLDHIQREHIKEPGVADRLTQLLIAVGLLRPDGTPVPPPRMAASAAGPAQPLAAAEPKPGELWTPDQQTTGGGKLWVPE
ncbi:MAG: hypothetical protein ACOY3P_16630 [Planctomycetota bacterium]